MSDKPINTKREELLYAKMKEAGIKEGIEEVFFFPTVEDQKIARALTRRHIFQGGHSGPPTAIRLVAERAACPLEYLRIVRRLGRDVLGRD